MSRLRWPVLVSFAVAGLALAACVDQLAQAHALLGVDEYDDGVYLGAALRVVNGAAPYRDFTFPHPPGMILLLSPLAGLARWTGTRAFAGEARVLTALVASANAGLLVWLMRHRGTPAMVIAGGTLAVFPLAVAADHTVLLEPYLVLFCLLGAMAMFAGDSLASRKRLVWGGVAFGFAGAVKIWAIFPLAVALGCCVPEFRRGLRTLLGAVAGFTLASWPFFLLAPTNFVRDTIVLQLDRTPSPGGSVSPGGRLLNVTGLVGLPGLHATVHLAVIVAVVYSFVVACAYLVPPSPSRLDWFALGSASVTVAAVFVAADFGPHYTYFTAAFLALLLAVSCERLMRPALDWAAGRRGTVIGRSPAQAPRLVVVVVVLLVLATVFAEGRLFIREQPWRVNFGDPGPPIARVIPKGACVVTDEPAFAIIADRFVADSSNCPALVDSFGEWLAADPRHPPPSPGPYDPGLVSAWRTWFSRADYVILTSQFRIPWTPELRSWFASHFKAVSFEGAQVHKARR